MATLQERISQEMNRDRREELIALRKRIEVTNRWIGHLQRTVGTMEEQAAAMAAPRTFDSADAQHLDIRA